MSNTIEFAKLINLLRQGHGSKEFKAILDCIEDGIFITDGKGNIITLNQASLDLCPYREDQLIGKNMNDLVNNKFFEDSVSLKAIEQRKNISVIQKSQTGNYDLLVTATLLFEGDEISLVVLTERNIDELNLLQSSLRNLNERYTQEVEYYRKQTTSQNKIAYGSKMMGDLLSTTLRIAKTDANVLIQGESGTGKSLIAKYIYDNSERAKKSFIEINCGAIAENLLESELFGYEKGAFTGASESGKIGLFELANNGTLFLDEIGTLPLHLQVKILRAIQEKEIMRVGATRYIPIDIRIIAATNTNLAEAVKAGTFRKDLFYRLNVFQLVIPPLREHPDDILPICTYFLEKFNTKYQTHKTLSEGAWKLLYNYQWPGNVREIENFLERIVIIFSEDHITDDQIIPLLASPEIESAVFDNAASIDLKKEVMAYEKALLTAKSRHFPTVSALADALNIDKSTAMRKLKRYTIKMPHSLL